MFQGLVITLREGVEAALVLSIAIAVLERRGLAQLRGALFAGAAAALALSVVAAAVTMRITYNVELFEGVVMMIGAALVLSLVWWMWRAAPRFHEEIESGVARAAEHRAGPAAAAGVFLFAFGMVFREGLETAVFLAAAGFNSQGLGMWIGAGIGLALAVAFGVLFERGALRIPLKPFFSVTSAVLLLIAAQLLVGGLHELSEAEVLPSSRAEMAVVGPLVRNELLLFTLTVALATGWLLFGARRARQAAAAATGPEARLMRAAAARDDARRRWIGIVGAVVLVLLVAAFVQGSRVPPRAPAIPVEIRSGRIAIDAASVADGHLHFFEAALAARPARFFVIRVGDRVHACFDACEICGDQGYFEEQGAVVCRNCTAPIVLTSIGRSGGCNPIPLPLREVDGRLEIAVADLEAGLPLLHGR